MATTRRNVLLVGVDREMVERVVPLLRREEIEVLSMAASPGVLNLLRDTPMDVLIVRYPLRGPGLEELLQEVRSPQSLCREAGIILVADDVSVDEAMRFEGAGVNRVMAERWTGAHLWQALADLLEVAPRAAVRTLAHLEIRLGARRRQDLAQSVNLSASGVLLESPTRPRPGTPLRLTFRLPEETRPLRAAAEVVRHAEPQREGVGGFAVRFISLEDDGATRVRRWVAGRV